MQQPVRESWKGSEGTEHQKAETSRSTRMQQPVRESWKGSEGTEHQKAETSRNTRMQQPVRKPWKGSEGAEHQKMGETKSAQAEKPSAQTAGTEHFKNIREERERISRTIKSQETVQEKDHTSITGTRSPAAEFQTPALSRPVDLKSHVENRTTAPQPERGKDGVVNPPGPADSAHAFLHGAPVTDRDRRSLIQEDSAFTAASRETTRLGIGPSVKPSLQEAPSPGLSSKSDRSLDQIKEGAAIDSLFVLRQYAEKRDAIKQDAEIHDELRVSAGEDWTKDGNVKSPPDRSVKVTPTRGKDILTTDRAISLLKGFLLSTSQDIYPRPAMKQGPEHQQRLQGEELRIRLDGNTVEFNTFRLPNELQSPSQPGETEKRALIPKTETPRVSLEEKSGVLSAEPGKRPQSKPPIQEKSFVERRKAQKSQDSEPVMRIGDIHTAPINSVRELERMYSMTGGSFFTAPGVLDANRQFIRMTEKFDVKKAVENEGITVIGDIQGGEERYHDSEYYGDSMREERREESFRGSLPRTPRKQAEHLQEKALEQSHLNTIEIRKSSEKEEVIQDTIHEVAQSVKTDKQIETKKVDQASQHATTSIESVIKKSQNETWTGDEMAAKLIWLLMKAASTFTFEHSSRVIGLSTDLAREIGVTDESQLKTVEEGAMFHDIGEAELNLQDASPQVKSRLSKYLGSMDLKNCSFLHDIGKVKIPDSILYKPGRLTDEEFEVLKQHPVIGEQILKPIPSMQHVLPVVRHHHEKWDGKGYPDGLTGENTPLPARIVSITDAYDAMVSDRPYRKGMPVEDALKELKRCAGTHFDPQLVQAFVKVIERNQRNGGEV